MSFGLGVLPIAWPEINLTADEISESHRTGCRRAGRTFSMNSAVQGHQANLVGALGECAFRKHTNNPGCLYAFPGETFGPDVAHLASGLTIDVKSTRSPLVALYIPEDQVKVMVYNFLVLMESMIFPQRWRIRGYVSRCEFQGYAHRREIHGRSTFVFPPESLHPIENLLTVFGVH